MKVSIGMLLFAAMGTAWAAAGDGYANRDIEVREAPLPSAASIGKLHRAEQVALIESAEEADWVKVRGTCSYSGAAPEGWVPRESLSEQSAFSPVSHWPVEKYEFETLAGDYGVRTGIDFEMNGAAHLTITEMGDEFVPPPKQLECLTYTAGKLAQLRCGVMSDVALTLPFDPVVGRLFGLPCPIGGIESDITVHEKFALPENPTPEVLERMNRWLNAPVIGNDNSEAKFAGVTLSREKDGYTAHFKSRYGYVCGLAFDAMGLPYILRACRSAAYPYDTPDEVIVLTCDDTVEAITCTGLWHAPKPYRSADTLYRFALVMKHAAIGDGK